MIRNLLVVVLLSLSCGPADQTVREMSQVSPAGLVAYYRDNPRGTAFTNRRIQCRLDPGGYAVDGRDVLYYTGLPHTPPVCVFRCVSDVNAKPQEHWLVLTGLCTGPVRDGVRKGDRITFTIYVEDCVVTRVESR